MSRRARRLIACGRLAALLLVSGAVTAHAQSLADLARQERERRRTAASERVYTDADLPQTGRSSERPPAVELEPPPPALTPAADDGRPDASAAALDAAADDAASGPGAAGTVVEGREKRDEQYWRDRARNIRARLARAVADADAARTRLEALAGGAGGSTASRERDVLTASLQRLDTAVGYLQSELEQLESRARIENVPADWLQ